MNGRNQRVENYGQNRSGISSLNGKQITLTQEQIDIINCDHGDIVIEALAGSAKTTTLVEYALKYPHIRFLYAVFNVSIKDEAVHRFPQNTYISTVNALAFNYFFGEGGFRRTQDNFVNSESLIRYQEVFKHDYSKVQITKGFNFFKKFCNSSLQFPLTEIEVEYRTHKNKEVISNEQMCRLVNRICHALFNKGCTGNLIDGDQALRYDQSSILKWFELQQINFNYDVVLFDECQDSNAVTTSIVKCQKSRKIFVGDSHQAIYQFRGAVDELNQLINLPDINLFALTKTFRFSQSLAKEVTNYLRKFKGEQKSLIGNEGVKTNSFVKEEVILDIENDIKNSEIINIQELFANENIKIAKLFRTNAGFFEEVELLLKNGIDYEVNGGLEKYKFEVLEDIYRLKQLKPGEPKNTIKSWEIRFYDSYQELTNEVKDENAPDEIARLHKFVEERPGVDIIDLCNQIREGHYKGVALPQKLELSTVHVSKGKEWDTVILANDFFPSCQTGSDDTFMKRFMSQLKQYQSKKYSLKFTKEDAESFECEINVLYVALTRVKQHLFIPSSVKKLLDFAKK